ncbi:MAG: class I tRNA ligase family protein, partial [Flavobacteriales bacterium]
ITANDLRQDEDVMDTWFSSWLWPISVFDGFYNKEEVDYYYPTNDLVTAPEIMFFWVARMIVAGYEYRGELPFKNVYYTGIVRDQQGRKMSKSLGNSPDPIVLMDQYGADGVRVGMLLTSPAGNDLPFDEKLCEQGRNFSNKIWNAFRLVHAWEVKDMEQRPQAKIAHEWFEAKKAVVINEINESFDKFKISEALMSTYKLVWDDFCSWYLEMIKPPYGEAIDALTLKQVTSHFEDLLKLLHPFTPFISEELWHHLAERAGKEDALIVAPWPKGKSDDSSVLDKFDASASVVGGVRVIRKENNIPNKIALQLAVLPHGEVDKNFDSVIMHLCNVDQIEYVAEKPENCFTFIANGHEFFVPFGDNIDTEAEKEKIVKELEYTKGSLKIVMKKLGNERFVSSAPAAVVDAETKKKDDAEAKIKVLEEKLLSIG